MVNAKHLTYGGLIFAITVIILGGYAIYNSSQNNLDNQTISGNFLHVEGDKVIDSSGNIIYLRGFNLGPLPFASIKNGNYTQDQVNQYNKAALDAFVAEDDIKNIKSMGGNVIRIHLDFFALENSPYNYNDEYLELYNKLAVESYKKGVYIIPASGAAQNSKQQDNIARYNGETYLYKDAEFRKRFIDAWGHIAKYLADNPGIAGYDILNEPEAPTKEDLHSVYSELISEIRKYDKNHIIILERQHFSNSDQFLFGGFYNDTNIMLSTHYYEDEALTGGTGEKYTNKEQLEQGITDFLSLEEAQGKPFFLGEFSAETKINGSTPEALRWTTDFIGIMKQKGVHFAYFPYKGIYAYWDYHDNGASRGLYQYTSAPNQSESIEQKINNLHTENLKEFFEIRNILENGFKD